MQFFGKHAQKIMIKFHYSYKFLLPYIISISKKPYKKREQQKNIYRKQKNPTLNDRVDRYFSIFDTNWTCQAIFGALFQKLAAMF